MLQIRVVAGEGAVNSTGARGPGLTLEVVDELGRPVAGAVVSVRLPDDGPAGAFASGLATEIVTTGADGRVTTAPIRWNRLAGPLQIRITAAKDRARAGTVVAQQLIDARRGGGGPVARAKSRKWVPIVLIAAGAAGAGFGIGMASRGRAGEPAAAAPAGVGIGQPTITVSKP